MQSTDDAQALPPQRRGERGEVASWLLLMAGLALAAVAAGTVLTNVIGVLAARVGEHASLEATAPDGATADPRTGLDGTSPPAPGDPGAADPDTADVDTPDPAVSAATQLPPQDAASLATDVYSREPGSLPEGWTRVDPDNIPQELRDLGVTREMLVDEEIGYDAAIYQSDDGSYVVAFRGTDGGDPEQANLDNIHANAPQQLGFGSAQYDRANQLVETMAAGVPDGQLSLTGHSLGGGLASVAGLANEVPATVYDPAGIHPETLERYGADPARANEFITGYQVDGEILSNDVVPVDFPVIGWRRNTMQPRIGTIHALPAIDENGQRLPPIVDPGPGPGFFAPQAEHDAWNQAMAEFEAEGSRRHGMDFIERGLEATGNN